MKDSFSHLHPTALLRIINTLIINIFKPISSLFLTSLLNVSFFVFMLIIFFNMMRFNSMENYEGSNKIIITKQEGEDDNNLLHRKQISSLSTLPSKLSSSRQWRGFENKRIVRVSRALGGKDRHSKVCTIRGIRDRRIRLSVPTATQLYDLQDKLGLNQPSKVVDWLLDVTKNEIDKLPPLQIPPGGLFPQDYSSSSMLASHTHVENLENYGGYVSTHSHQLAPQNFSHNNNNINTTSNNNSSLALQPLAFSQSQLYISHSIPNMMPSIILPPNKYPPFMHLSSSMENEQSRQNAIINNFQLSSSSSSSQHAINLLLRPTTALHLIGSPMKTSGLNGSPFGM